MKMTENDSIWKDLPLCFPLKSATSAVLSWFGQICRVFALSAGTPLSQKFKFIPVVSHTVLAVPQQFLGGNMHHAPAANNPGVIIPSQPLNQRPPNMPPPPPPPAPFYDQSERNTCFV